MRINRLFTTLAFSLAIGAQAQQQDLLARANESYFKQEWDKAIPNFEKVLGDTSQSALLWQRIAMCNFMTGKTDASLRQYNRALGLGPNPFLKGIIQSQILAIYDRLNKPDAAWGFLQKEAGNGFNNLPLLDTLRVFNSLRKSEPFVALYGRVKLNSYPCMGDPRRADFDFWVGEWDVYKTGTDAVVGHSVITKLDGSCSILESWQSLVSPQTGHSINYYDPTKGSWEQVYVGSGGNVTKYVDGKYEEGKMHFTYQSTYNGSPYNGNFIFYNQGPNQVRQFQDYTTDGGKTFVSTTDLTYKRKQK